MMLSVGVLYQCACDITVGENEYNNVRVLLSTHKTGTDPISVEKINFDRLLKCFKFYTYMIS